MTRIRAAALPLVILALAAGAGARSPHPEAVFLALADLESGWDIVDEAPGGASRDPDLVRWGVRDKRTRHYTHLRDDVAEVCSIEVWRFRDAGRASAALAGFAYPDWRFAQVGELLLAAHGHRRPRSGAATRGIFPACGELFTRTQERAEALR